MGRRLIALAVACAALACAAGPAAAMPSPYPRYDNRAAPVLADGQQHGAGGGTVTPPSGAPEGGATAGCRKAKKKVRKARRKVKALKRKLRRGRTRALSRRLRTWKRKLKRAKRGARRRCAAATAAAVPSPSRRPGPATAAGHGGAYHRSGLILCEGNQLYMYAGPDMRSMSPNYVQGVGFRVAVFSWTGSRWAYVTEYGQYWWGTAGYSTGPYEYYDESDRSTNQNQGFTINRAGHYRMAVRYHWWPNSRGGRTGTAWHWGGAHTYLQSGARADYCTYG